jgi:hypothetical protein
MNIDWCCMTWLTDIRKRTNAQCKMDLCELMFFSDVYCTRLESRDSSVGIATVYGLDDRGVGVRVPVGSRISLLHVVQTGSGAHPASYPMGTGGFSSGVKLPGREVDHSPPTSAEVKKTWIHTPTPSYVFIA